MQYHGKNYRNLKGEFLERSQGDVLEGTSARIHCVCNAEVARGTVENHPCKALSNQREFTPWSYQIDHFRPSVCTPAAEKHEVQGAVHLSRVHQLKDESEVSTCNYFLHNANNSDILLQAGNTFFSSGMFYHAKGNLPHLRD